MREVIKYQCTSVLPALRGDGIVGHHPPVIKLSTLRRRPGPLVGSIMYKMCISLEHGRTQHLMMHDVGGERFPLALQHVPVVCNVRLKLGPHPFHCVLTKNIRNVTIQDGMSVACNCTMYHAGGGAAWCLQS